MPLIPVYPVGLGSDKRPANLRVVDLEAPERVYPGDKFTLTGYVQAQNYSRAQRHGRAALRRQPTARTKTKEDEQTLDVGQVRPGRAGQVRAEARGAGRPAVQAARASRSKARSTAATTRRPPRSKSSTAARRCCSSPAGRCATFIFLRNQLFRDKEVICDVWLQSGKPGISQEANELLYKFPETEDELFEYDAIVAFDPDWEQLDEQQVKLLERWVAEKAGGLIVVAGPVFTPQWSSRRRGDPRIDTLKALYPVAFYYQGSATLSLGRFGSEKSWPLQFTRDGLEAEFLWLDEDAAASEQAWEQFEGVCGYYAVKDPKPGRRVYARFGDPDTAIDNVQPIYMAGQFYGSGPRVLHGQRRDVARAAQSMTPTSSSSTRS